MYKLFDVDESYTELETNDLQFKKRVIDTLSVYVEGYKYSPLFRSGIWDGKKNFYTIQSNTNIRFPKGLVQYIIQDLEKNGYEYTYTRSTLDTKIDFEEFKEFVKSLNIPFEPYDYQLKAAFDSIKYKRLLNKAATSSGKSLIIYLIISWMLSKKYRTILVVPTISLTLQMKGDFEDYGLKNSDDLIKLIGGEFNNKDLSEKPVIISTWQSLQNLNKQDFEIFDCIIVDEAHGAASDVLSNIVKNAKNSKWKLGLTGTVPRERERKMELLASLGKLNNVITAQGLIERGLATPVNINMVYVNYTDDDILKLHSKKFTYQEEDKFICEHYSRNYTVSKMLVKLASKANTLALFSKVEHGKLLLRNSIELKTGIRDFKLLEKITPKGITDLLDYTGTIFCTTINDELLEKINKTVTKLRDKDFAKNFITKLKSLEDIHIYFIYGGVNGSDREDIRKILETVEYSETGGALVIASFQTVATGTNYKKLRHIVTCSSGKSSIRINQTIGRGMRLHDSKDCVDYWDIIDDISKKYRNSKKYNYAMLHSYERLEMYRENEYPIKEIEINL